MSLRMVEQWHMPLITHYVIITIAYKRRNLSIGQLVSHQLPDRTDMVVNHIPWGPSSVLTPHMTSKLYLLVVVPYLISRLPVNKISSLCHPGPDPGFSIGGAWTHFGEVLASNVGTFQ